MAAEHIYRPVKSRAIFVRPRAVRARILCRHRLYELFDSRTECLMGVFRTCDSVRHLFKKLMSRGVATKKNDKENDTKRRYWRRRVELVARKSPSQAILHTCVRIVGALCRGVRISAENTKAFSFPETRQSNYIRRTLRW